MKAILFTLGFYLIFVALGCSGCGGVKKGVTKSETQKTKDTQTVVLNVEKPQKYICDFSLRSNGSNTTIIFPNGNEINTNDYKPILNQIPIKAIKYEEGEDSYGRKGINYKYAMIDFTKIDKKTKEKLTKNMHFEFPMDVDSLLYAEYRVDFPYDTTVVMPEYPEINELLTIYARCWKGCHKGEHGMEIIIGTIGNYVKFDKQANKLTEFYSDRFGRGEFSNDNRFFGGAVGGYYSDGGGFYRKTRIYIYNLKTKQIVFHKLIDFGKDIQFFYIHELNKWRFHIEGDNHDGHFYIDPWNGFSYNYILTQELKAKYLTEKVDGYFFKDTTSILFERDFEKTPLSNIATPYYPTIK